MVQLYSFWAIWRSTYSMLWIARIISVCKCSFQFFFTGWKPIRSGSLYIAWEVKLRATCQINSLCWILIVKWVYQYFYYLKSFITWTVMTGQWENWTFSKINYKNGASGKRCFAVLYLNRQVGKHVNICMNEADDALLFWPWNAASSQHKNQTISHWLPRINMYSLGPNWDPVSMSDTGCFALIYWQKYQTLSDGGALRTWPEGQWAAK